MPYASGITYNEAIQSAQVIVMENLIGNPIDNMQGSAVTHERMATELAHVLRALQTLSAGNRTLLRATDEVELLHDMCEVIVETGGYCFACVGYAQHDERKSIHWESSFGIDTEYLELLNLTWADTEQGKSASGTAIRTGQPSVGRHLLTDPVYAEPAHALLRETARQNGFGSASAFPLRMDGEVFGALAMVAAEPDAFDEAEVKLLNELADDLAFGIANLRARLKHRAAEETIARMAYFDTLTGLPNRTSLLEYLREMIQDAKQRRRSLALLHLQVGNFHEINKVLGYRAGDELLQHLGKRLAGAIQQNDRLARVGEAEFAILLPNGSADYAIQVAQRLAFVLRMPVDVANLMLDASVAIGISLFPGHATDADALIRCANTATRLAKPTRGGYALYTGGHEQEYTRRLTLMGDMHRAIGDNELRLYCQPKVDIASRRVRGAEALVRWEHPQHGMLPTAEFIQLAEQAGTITPLTNWMLDAAFRQCYTWHEARREWPLAVNLSAHDLYDPGLVDRIRGLFSTWGIAPEMIQFELTESALMSDPAGALETLVRLRDMGVKLFIDDFGTGYSGFSYLQKFPVDAIKIDQSFVRPMIESGDSAMIVHSMIELGHNLGRDVVAEGVESQAIWARLATLGCDVAQGYLIGMPMPAEQFDAWEDQWTHASA